MAKRAKRDRTDNTGFKGKVAEAGDLPPAAGVGEGVRKILLYGSVLFASLYTAVNSFLFVNLSDEGVAAMDGWRIALGQIPHRDFFEIVPPLSFYPTALAIKAIGPTVLAVRSVTLLLGLALIWAVDLVVRRFTRDTSVRVMAILVTGAWGVSVWPCPSHHWYSSLFHLLTVFTLARSLESKRGFWWAFAAGCTTAADVLSLHDQGAYFLLGLLVLFFPLVADSAAWRRSFLGWLAGGIASGLPAATALVSAAGLKELWYQLVLWPMTQYRQTPANRIGFGDLFRELAEIHRSAGFLDFTMEFMLDLLPLIAIAAVVLSYLKKWFLRPVSGLLAAAVLSAMGSLLHRLSVLNIHWIMPVLLPCACIAFSRLVSNKDLFLRYLGKVAIWIGIGASGLYCINFLGGSVLGGRLSRMHTQAGTILVYTPGGEGGQRNPESDLIGAVERFVPPGVPVFTRGFIPYINYLTGHPNPTRYNFTIHPLYNTDAQAKEIVETLERQKVQYIIGNVISTGPSLLDDYILANYEIVWRNEGYFIFKRKV